MCYIYLVVLRYRVLMLGKKTTMKDKAAPFAAGAAVTAGAVVGVAAAKALSDKKTRKKIVKELSSAKKQATKTVSEVVDKRGEMLDMVKVRAEKMMPKKEVLRLAQDKNKKAAKKVSSAKKSTAVKASSAVKKATKKSPKKTNHVATSKPSSVAAAK